MPFGTTIFRLSVPRPEPAQPAKAPPRPPADPARAIARPLAALSRRLSPPPRIEAGLLAFEQRLLAALAAKDAPGIAALAERLGADPAQVSRAVKRLAAQHLVTAGQAPDRRQRPLALSPSGRMLAERLAQTQAERLTAALEGLSPELRDRLAAVLAEALKALPATSEAEVSEAPAELPETSYRLRMARPGDLARACGLAAEHDGGWAAEAKTLALAADFLAARDPARDCAWVAAKPDGTLAALALYHGSATLPHLTTLYAETDTAAREAEEACEVFAEMAGRVG